MKVGDLVIGRIRGNIGLIFKHALKPKYVWVCWCSGAYFDKSTLEAIDMLYLYNGGDEHGKHLLDRR